jgi:hypothetical protein
MGVLLQTGVNDLQTLFPAICQECDGWDASTFHAFSNKKMPWKCSKGHRWIAMVANRTKHGKGCPYCANKYAWPGDNDLATLFPDLAKEAYGWNASRCLPYSHEKKRWVCPSGHIWECVVNKRTARGTGCPICSKRVLIPGVNDLKTMFPVIAAQAFGWDAELVQHGSSKKRKWLCDKGHVYTATPNHRTRPESPTGCPCCRKTGYNKNKKGWVYLMNRNGEQQIGITNKPKQRIKTHSRKGWYLVDLIGPINGCLAADIELIVRRYLDRRGLKMQGTYENWSTQNMEVRSLRELLVLAGVDGLLCGLLS